MLRKLSILALLVAFGLVTFGCQSTPNAVTGDNHPAKITDKNRVAP